MSFPSLFFLTTFGCSVNSSGILLV